MMPICSGFWRGGESWWNKNAVLFINFLFIKNRCFGICKCCVSRICSWQYCCSTIVGGWLFLGSVLHFCPSRNQSGGFLWCYVVILWCPSVMGFGGPVNLGTRMLLFLFGISKSCGWFCVGFDGGRHLVHADGDYHRAGLCSLVLSTLGVLQARSSLKNIETQNCK